MGRASWTGRAVSSSARREESCFAPCASLADDSLAAQSERALIRSSFWKSCSPISILRQSGEMIERGGGGG